MHRLTDWPVFHHVAPLLECLGVDAEALDAWHYFYAKEAVSYPFSHPLTTKPSSAAQEALRAVGDALAHVGAPLVGAPPGAVVFASFHLPTTREELEREAVSRGHRVVRIADHPLDALFEPRPSNAFELASWSARLDEIAGEPGRIAALLRAQNEMPAGLRVLTGLILDRWCRAGGFAKLDLDALEACARLGQHRDGPSFRDAAADLYRARVLDGRDASLAQLARVHQDSQRGSALTTEDLARFGEACTRACAREDTALKDWRLAKDLGIVDEASFARGVVPSFRRALAAGFRTPPHGHGDHDGFMACVAAVAAADPDLCLRGWLALTACFNENGLRTYRDTWHRVVPTTGFSAAALAEATAYVSHPARAATAKLLKRFLDARGIAITPSTPPELETIETTVLVSTDVGHLLVGSYEAVETISALEDPQAWPTAVKKHRCVGLETAGDGGYTVRVLGSTRDADPAQRVPGATHRARFPLAIRDDTLSVSGIVGAGGTPTIAFPSGTYAADVFETSDGVVSIVLRPVKKAPAWAFGGALPRVGLPGPA
jgi:hypothetical protein